MFSICETMVKQLYLVVQSRHLEDEYKCVFYTAIYERRIIGADSMQLKRIYVLVSYLHKRLIHAPQTRRN